MEIILNFKNFFLFLVAEIILNLSFTNLFIEDTSPIGIVIN